VLPTDAELELLAILWETGPMTVRDLHDKVSQRRDVGYTTVLKLLQIMHGKRLVARDERERSHIYSALAPRERTQRALLEDLKRRAFGGSSADLLQRALPNARASRDELRAIRELLKRFDGGAGR
jgi:predicted transcriptional regulator